MTAKLQVYKCEICGNMVEMVHEGEGTLVCCGEPMKLLSENSVDAAKEKHVPVLEKKQETVDIKVGSVPHPMEEKHFIEWIEVIVDGTACRKFLKPGESPEATFTVSQGNITPRAYCNLHGLWKGE